MKKKITRLCATVLLLSAGIAFPTVIQAQRVNTFTVEQQARIDSLKQGYIKKGVPAHWAEKRATMIVERESKAQLRSSTRLATPHAGSIKIDRGSTPGSYSSYHTAATQNDYADYLVKHVLLNNPAAVTAISNVHFYGVYGPTDKRSLAYFEYEGTDFPIDKGLILATGDVNGVGGESPEGPNDVAGGALSANGGYMMTGDPNLTPLVAPNTVQDGSHLVFDFKPFKPDVSFDFVFASEEYPQFSNSLYNDIFGFFVTELPSGTPFNIAYFPDGHTPVTINNSNWGAISSSDNDATHLGAPLPDKVNPQWHVPIYQGSPVMEYGGRTIKLTAKANGLSTTKTYRLSLKVANVYDDNWGSAVFLSNLDLGAPEVGLDTPYMGAWNREWDEQGKDHLYTDCIQTLKLGFLPAAFDRKLVLSYMGIASKENIRKADGSPLPDTLDLKANEELITFPVKILPVPAADNGKEGAIKACIVSGDCDTVMNKTTKHFFKFFNGIQTNIDFVAPSPKYPGRFKLNITGGSNKVYRSIDNGLHWEFARDTATGEERPFTHDQMEYFLASDRNIWLREPNACAQVQFFHFTKDSLAGPVQPGISRQVIMPEVLGLVSSYAPGIHYVNSGSDLTFRVMPTGANAGKVPVVETGRKSIPDKQGVRVVSNGDGTYTVTIYRVREAIDLRISFAAPNSNVEADGSSIYTERETLYVTSPTANTAKVYNVSGVLVRTLTLSAGETVRTALPAGFYVVALGNGNTHKVIVK